ncbi:methylenetetrahydrofolate reductase [Buchnera aphidicola]|nr:methylenetetrahydrofolate reductase [Buchnera aphidicola]
MFQNSHHIISSLFNTNILKNKLFFSFEFFPPKNLKEIQILLKIIKKLEFLNPLFFSLTHSAKETNYCYTEKILSILLKNTHIPVFPHLTGINFQKSEIIQIAQKYSQYDIKKIVVLRGDILKYSQNSQLYATDLIKILKNVNNFQFIVAAYPEIHPESKNMSEDLKNLKNKEKLGASSAITQFFFSVEKFLLFCKKCKKSNIKLKIIPGILPILSFKQLIHFTQLTNVHIPEKMLYFFSKYKNCPKKFEEYSIQVATNLIFELLQKNILHFHIYTLNRIYLFSKILNKLEKMLL